MQGNIDMEKLSDVLEYPLPDEVKNAVKEILASNSGKRRRNTTGIMSAFRREEARRHDKYP